MPASTSPMAAVSNQVSTLARTLAKSSDRGIHEAPRSVLGWGCSVSRQLNMGWFDSMQRTIPAQMCLPASTGRIPLTVGGVADSMNGHPFPLLQELRLLGPVASPMPAALPGPAAQHPPSPSVDPPRDLFQLVSWRAVGPTEGWMQDGVHSYTHRRPGPEHRLLGGQAHKAFSARPR
jgi:hypothetical protein